MQMQTAECGIVHKRITKYVENGSLSYKKKTMKKGNFMRKQRLHAISILSLFLLLVLVSCGESAPTSNTTQSRTSTSKTVLIQTNNSLSARSATDGTQLWSFSQSGSTLSHLVISANHLYWNSTSS